MTTSYFIDAVEFGLHVSDKLSHIIVKVHVVWQLLDDLRLLLLVQWKTFNNSNQFRRLLIDVLGNFTGHNYFFVSTPHKLVMVVFNHVEILLSGIEHYFRLIIMYSGFTNPPFSKCSIVEETSMFGMVVGRFIQRLLYYCFKVDRSMCWFG